MSLRAESGGKSRFDWGFIATVAGLVLMGSLAVFSAANPLPYYGQIVERHLLALFLGAALFAFAMNFNYQVFQDQAKTVYGLALALLVCVIIFGTSHKGHKAWLNLGVAAFQRDLAYEPSYPSGRLLALLELLLTSTLIALFLLAVRRQFRR